MTDLEKRAVDLTRRMEKALYRMDFDMAEQYRKDLDGVLDLILERRTSDAPS